MKKLFFAALAASLLASACTKDKETSPGTNNPNNPNSPGNLPDNGMRVSRVGAPDSTFSFTSVLCGPDSNSSGRFWDTRCFFNAGGPAYDRLSIAWRAEPTAGDYPVKSQGNYGNLQAGTAASNLTFRGYNNGIPQGNVHLSIVNGKKRIEFSDFVYYYSTASGQDSMKISGSFTCQ